MRFRPEILQTLRGYRREDLVADVGAGATVAVVALPLAMAFGIASGVTPEQGLVTAIIGGFIISALGGSRVQIGGPAGAFVVLLYAIVERHGVSGLLLSTMMAGVLLFALGALRLGQLVRFIPVSIVIGFTNGIAVIIALSQIRDLLGLTVERMPANFFSQLATLWASIHSINPAAVGLALGSLALVAVWPKSYRPQDSAWRKWLGRIPGTLVALLLGILFVSLAGIPVETIGSRFGGFAVSFSAPSLPSLGWDTAQQLAGPALSIALLCAIEALLCARMADSLIGARHDPNQELMAQGVANVVTPLFGGFAATGTIARTVTNVRSGARSPVSGLVHAAVLLVIVLALAPLASLIPLASLAAILLYVSWSMGDWKAFARLGQFSIPYRIILLATFSLTIVFDITVAVEVGLVLACLFFITRMASLTRLEPLALPAEFVAGPIRAAAYRLYGSLFFGSVTRLEALLEARQTLPGIVILEMHQLVNLDTSGVDALQTLHRALARAGGQLWLAHLNEQPASLIRRSGLAAELGSDTIFPSLDAALAALSGLAQNPGARSDQPTHSPGTDAA